jgi:hypothetical protein
MRNWSRHRLIESAKYFGHYKKYTELPLKMQLSELRRGKAPGRLHLLASMHGQTIYVDPTAEMVLVRFASFPRAQNGLIDPTSLPAYQAVAEYLMAQ